MADKSKAMLGRTVSKTGGTLAAAVETRYFTLAQGLQFNNTDLVLWPFMPIPDSLTASLADRAAPTSKYKIWPPSMKTRAPLAVVTTAKGFEYTSAVQGVKFVVKITNKKDEFRDALLDSGSHVIYAGHARYGRGPCFGVLPQPSKIAKTENWENGTSKETGIFRMGQLYIGVPMEEVLSHGYTADLVEHTVKVREKDCDHDLKPFVSKLKPKLAKDIDPGLPAQAKDKNPAKKWWAYRAPNEGKIEWHVVLHAGWTKTASDPFDLGAVTPKCRVFCHFGCSTFNHNRAILRDKAYKGWQKTGDDKFAFFTSSLSAGPLTARWLYHLFTYPKRNAFLDWEPSLTWAIEHTNADLKLDKAKFHLL